MNIEQIDSAIESLEKLKREIVGDKFEDLKKAFAEGAIIEYKKAYPWDVTINPTWRTDYKYRIKDDISISSWNKHKDIIKQYWKGAKVEFTYNDGFPQTVDSNIAWSTDCEYRVKDDISISSWNAHKDLIKQWWDGAEIEVRISKGNWVSLPLNPKWNTFERYRIKPNIWKLPEYEDGAIWTVDEYGQIQSRLILKSYTKLGRRRATEALAERCAKASKERDLLEAWRDYLEPDWKPDWTCPRYDKFYIGRNYDKRDGEYYINNADGCQTIGAVYMSKETAIQICDALNLGNISLED